MRNWFQAFAFKGNLCRYTEALRDCMMADPGYYGDMLPAAGEEEEEKEEEGKEKKKKEDAGGGGEGGDKPAAKDSKADGVMTGRAAAQLAALQKK